MPKFTASLNLPKYASAPSTPTDGDVYYNTTDHKVYSRVNGSWIDLGGAAGAEIYYQTSAPATANDGDIWVDSDDEVISVTSITDSTSTTSSTVAASATAVKSAYDLANGAIARSLVDAKGDLIVASAADTVTRIAVGTNGHVLTADSAEATGIKWAEASGGAEVFYQTSAPSTPSTGDIWVDSDDNTVTREAFYYQNDQPSTPMVGDIWVDANDDTTSAVIPTGSTSVVGIVQLTDSTSSTSTTTAATPNSVKLAYDLANTANTTANAGGTSWLTISGAKAGTALGLASRAYAVTNLGNKTPITISGTTNTLMPKETRRISATSDISSVGQAAATTWTLGRDSGVAGTSFLWGSSYGNGMYHATTYAISSTGTGIATSGAIRYSLDGSEWFQCELAGAPFTHNTAVQSVAYGNNMWIAGGENAQTAYSYDGITWTTFTPPNWASNTTRAAKYLNGIWFIGGDNARLATSTDGLSWTQRTPAINGSSMIYDITYGNGTYVLVGSDGQLATSTNGTSWTLRTSGFGASIITRVEYGNGIFVACGYDGKLRTSTDGITWTTRNPGMSTNTIMALAFGNGLFVIGSGSGSTGAISTSTDGITWTSRTSNFGSYNITTGTYGNGMFLFAGENTRFVTASDGSSNLLFTPISYTSV